MTRITVAAAVAVLLMGAPAFAQTTNQPSEPGTIPMNEAGYHQTLMLTSGKITAIDLAQGTLTLDTGTQFTLAPSFEYTSLPALGENVDVTYDEQNGKKVAHMIDVGGTNSHTSTD